MRGERLMAFMNNFPMLISDHFIVSIGFAV